MTQLIDPLIGKWIWMEMQGNGTVCIGEMDVMADGTAKYQERRENEGGAETVVFKSWENEIFLTWQRLADQKAFISFTAGGVKGNGYYVHIAPNQKMITLARLNSGNNNVVLAFKDESGVGTIDLLNTVCP